LVTLSEGSTHPLPAGVWSTLLTGASPGVHGFVEGTPLRQQRPDLALFSPDRLHKTLSDRGVLCAVVDVPSDCVVRPFNGVHIVDWGAEFDIWGLETEPRSWRRRLASRYGEHPLTRNPMVDITLDGLKRLRSELARGMGLKLRLQLDLLAGDYEFLFLNFAELHKAGHYFWKFFDPTHPDYDGSDRELAEALELLHGQLDSALGELLAKIGPDDNLIIISDRGMEHNHRAHHLLEEVLVRLGHVRQRKSAPQKVDSRGGHFKLLAKGGLRAFGRKIVPDALHDAIVPWYRWAIGEPPPTDKRTTRVFYEPGVGHSFLRVNLKGRDPQGVVEPGAEYDRLLEELGRELYALENAATGERVVKKIYHPWRLYGGPKRNELPDISIQWEARSKVDGVRSKTAGLIEKRWEDRRSGNHTNDAFLLCCGPAFTPAAQIEADARQLAPTVFVLLDQPIPAHCELGPLSEVMQSAVAASAAAAG
jgi:predicted AlkP superfamily phosphohydrolase/phosphomutase